MSSAPRPTPQQHQPEVLGAPPTRPQPVVGVAIRFDLGGFGSMRPRGMPTAGWT